MGNDTTKFDRIIRKMKDNKAVVAVLVMGTIIIAIAQFSGAVSTLWETVSKGMSVRAVEGRWQSGVLKSGGDEPFTMGFDFRVMGDTLQGTIRTRSVSGSYSMTYDVLDGTVQGNAIRFSQEHKTFGGGSVKSNYDGTVSKDQIEFLVRSGFVPKTFIVKRQ